MKMTIADRLRPFSHTLGHEAVIPGTLYKVRVYPAALEVISLETFESKRFIWDLQGPVHPFTVEQDLETSTLKIYGEALQGYFRLVLKKEMGNLVLFVEKAPLGLTSLVTGDKIVVFALKSCVEKRGKDRLFLGNDKQKDWDQIRKRRNLAEILPLWHGLGQLSPESKQGEGPIFALLEDLKERVAKQDRNLEELFLKIYLAGFSGGLVPRAHDDEFQGFVPLFEGNLEACSLLSLGSELIRSLFFQEKEGVYYILPCVLPQFVFGKLLGIVTKNGMQIDLEWSKGFIRRVVLSPKQDGPISLRFLPEVKGFRLKKNYKDAGSFLTRDVPILAKVGERLYLDCFQN
jgi:hypothetical protein